jgi:hypothetical protein
MRRRALLGLALALAAASVSLTARAADVDAMLAAPPPSATETAVVTASPAGPTTARGLPRLGVMADAGLPDGANASLVYRPLRWLRVHGGGGYNMVSEGIRAGATVVPFGMGPSATLETGHYFDGNANGVVQRFAGQSFSSPLLQRVGYDYCNFHLGLDFGYRRVTFFVHGGMSYVRAQVHNLDSVVSSQASAASDGNGTTSVSIKQDPTVQAWFPSAKLGLIVYF